MRYAIIKTYKLLAIMLIAATSACSNVGYLDNSDVKAIHNIEPRQSGKTSKAPRKLGAIALFKKDEAGNSKEDRIFMISRQKSRIGAETVLFDNSNTKDKMFKRSYFGVEADRKKKALAMRLRFTY